MPSRARSRWLDAKNQHKKALPHKTVHSRSLMRAVDHAIARSSLRDFRTNSRMRFRSAMLSRVKNPCLTAFLLPSGAPDPAAPPCIRQRFLPPTAGDLQGLPERVFAPQRALESIAAVLRL